MEKRRPRNNRRGLCHAVIVYELAFFWDDTVFRTMSVLHIALETDMNSETEMNNE